MSDSFTTFDQLDPAVKERFQTRLLTDAEKREAAFMQYAHYIEYHPDAHSEHKRFEMYMSLFSSIDSQNPLRAWADTVCAQLSPKCLYGNNDDVVAITARPSLDLLKRIVEDSNTVLTHNYFSPADREFFKCMIRLEMELRRNEYQTKRDTVPSSPYPMIDDGLRAKYAKQLENLQYWENETYPLPYVIDVITQSMPIFDNHPFEGWIEHARRDNVASLQLLVQALDQLRAANVEQVVAPTVAPTVSTDQAPEGAGDFSPN